MSGAGDPDDGRDIDPGLGGARRGGGRPGRAERAAAGRSRIRPPAPATGTSPTYYDRPVLKAPVWKATSPRTSSSAARPGPARPSGPRPRWAAGRGAAGAGAAGWLAAGGTALGGRPADRGPGAAGAVPQHAPRVPSVLADERGLLGARPDRLGRRTGRCAARVGRHARAPGRRGRHRGRLCGRAARRLHGRAAQQHGGAGLGADPPRARPPVHRLRGDRRLVAARPAPARPGRGARRAPLRARWPAPPTWRGPGGGTRGRERAASMAGPRRQGVPGILWRAATGAHRGKPRPLAAAALAPRRALAGPRRGRVAGHAVRGVPRRQGVGRRPAGDVRASARLAARRAERPSAGVVEDDAQRGAAGPRATRLTPWRSVAR